MPETNEGPQTEQKLTNEHSRGVEPLAVENAEVTPSPEEAFNVALSDLQLPELEEDRQALEESAKKLIERHGITPELFDAAHSVFFAAAAQRFMQLERRKENIPPAQYDEEMAFIDNAVAMLAWDKQADFGDKKLQIDTERANESPKKEAYEKFANPDLTHQLKAAIQEGLFSPVDDKLDDDHEQVPYEVYVIDFGFLDEKVCEKYAPLGLSNAEKQRLADNAVRFQTEGQMAYAGRTEGWMVPVDGQLVLAIPTPVAIALLHGQDGDLKNGAHKTLLHEYAHTQGCLSCDGHASFIGSMAEEARADFLADDDGYPDIKHFMEVDLYLVSGEVMTHIIQDYAGDNDPGAFWAEIGRKFGLQTMLELGLTVPQSLLNEDVRPLQAQANKHLGGFDGIVQRIYEQNLQDPALEAAMNERLAPHIAWFADMLTTAPEQAKNWSQFWHAKGMGFIVNLLESRARQSLGPSAK